MIQIQNNRKGGTLEEICKWYYNSIIAKLQEKIKDSSFDEDCKKLNTVRNDCKCFLTKNIDDIIKGKPERLIEINDKWIQEFCTTNKKLSLFDSYSAAIKKKAKTRTQEEQEVIKYIKSYLSVFDYEHLLTKTIKYALAAKLDIKVCPYCNRNYTFTISVKESEKSRALNMRPDFDHFFSKSKHPILALSFYNLIPSCSICNRTLKGDTEFTIDGNIHPYVEGFPSDVKFNYDPKSVNEALGIDDKCKISLDYNSSNDKVKNNDETFGLKAIYSQHGDIVAEIITKHYKTNGRYLESLATQFQGLSEPELYRIAFANYHDDEDFEKRPMAKLTKDIYEQLGFIVPLTINPNP